MSPSATFSLRGTVCVCVCVGGWVGGWVCFWLSKIVYVSILHPGFFIRASSSVLFPFVHFISGVQYRGSKLHQVFWLSQLIIEYPELWTFPSLSFLLSLSPSPPSHSLSSLISLLPSSLPLFLPSPLLLYTALSAIPLRARTCIRTAATTISTSNGDCVCTHLPYLFISSLQELQGSLSVRGGGAEGSEERELEEEEGHWSLPGDDECWCHWTARCELLLHVLKLFRRILQDHSC